MSKASLDILHTNFHRGWGGQPARILMLSQGLIRRGHRVVLAVPAGSRLAQKARESGIETFEEPKFRKTSRFFSALGDAACLNRFLGGRRFDLVDAHGSQDVWAVVAAKRLGHHRLPIVFTRHNTKRVADHPLNRWLYRRGVGHLIVASESVLRRYAPFLERGDLDRRRISVVHSSYWEERFHPGIDGKAVRSELGAADDACFLIGVVGRLVQDKGGIHFLRAAARIAGEFPGARFLFVGKGTEEARLRSAARDLGLANRTLFLGFREDVPEVTAALDLSVLPSVDCDASSAAVKEAMAVGRPVVATEIGGAGEIIRHGETGLVVPPGDAEALAGAMRSILSLPDRGIAMGERGAARVRKEFGQDRLVSGTLVAYQRALSASSG